VALLQLCEIKWADLAQDPLSYLVYKVVLVKFGLVDDVGLGLLDEVFAEDDHLHQLSFEHAQTKRAVVQLEFLLERCHLREQGRVLVGKVEEAVDHLVSRLEFDVDFTVGGLHGVDLGLYLSIEVLLEVEAVEDVQHFLLVIGAAGEGGLDLAVGDLGVVVDYFFGLTVDGDFRQFDFIYLFLFLPVVDVAV